MLKFVQKAWFSTPNAAPSVWRKGNGSSFRSSKNALL